MAAPSRLARSSPSLRLGGKPVDEDQGVVVARHDVDAARGGLPAHVHDVVAAVVQEALRRLDRALLQILHC